MIARGYESYVAIPLRSDGRRITPIGYGGVAMMVRATTTARPADTVALAVSARQTGTVHTQKYSTANQELSHGMGRSRGIWSAHAFRPGCRWRQW